MNCDGCRYLCYGSARVGDTAYGNVVMEEDCSCEDPRMEDWDGEGDCPCYEKDTAPIEMEKTVTTELYSSVKDEDGRIWYITVQRVERSDLTFYNIQKERSGDGRSKTEIQVDEAEAKVLMELLRTALGVEE